MKLKIRPEKRKRKGYLQKEKGKLRSLLVLTFGLTMTFLMAFGIGMSPARTEKKVFASGDIQKEQKNVIPSGMAGVLNGIVGAASSGSTVNRLGTSFGRIMVGQRVSTVNTSTADLDVSASMENGVNVLDAKAVSLAAHPKLMSDTDYETLLRIVEAEAGSEDVKGRILVANVIMNRVKHEEFPGNVTDVVWERRHGVVQFSPTADGSIGRVSVSDKTKEAVRQVMEGVDYSEGALFFIQKDAADPKNVTWFDKNLKKLLKHGVHEFYTYPEQADSTQQVAG